MRLSALALCVSGCFLGLGLASAFALRLCYGRNATFHVDGIVSYCRLWAGVFSAAGSVLLGFWFSNLGGLKVFAGCDFAVEVVG